jgi:hypothetical protein
MVLTIIEDHSNTRTGFTITLLEITTMMHFRILICCAILSAFCTTAMAYDLQQGLHGMKWGSSITVYPDLSEVKTSDQAVYYTDASMSYQVVQRPVPAVYYGFYRKKFFAVFIKLRSPDQFVHLKDQFSTKYGPPKHTYYESTKQTVYRWKDANVKIKMKMIESRADYKLAIYNTPLAAALNEERLENIASETFQSTPAKEGEPTKTAPLFNF